MDEGTRTEPLTGEQWAEEVLRPALGLEEITFEDLQKREGTGTIGPWTDRGHIEASQETRDYLFSKEQSEKK